MKILKSVGLWITLFTFAAFPLPAIALELSVFIIGSMLSAVRIFFTLTYYYFYFTIFG